MTRQNLLIVDDEHMVIKSLRRLLRSEEYSVYSASSGFDGVEVLKKHDIGVILSDVMMPGMNGVDFLEKCRRLKPNTVRMLLTGHATLDNAVDAVNRSKVFCYLTKPWVTEELRRTITNAFEYYNLVVENERLQKLTHRQNIALSKINESL